MRTGWQREFAAASNHTQWNEKCLREDLQAGKLDGKTVFVLSCEYDLSERKVKNIMAETQHDADIINRERDRLRASFTEYFAGMGIDVNVAHFTGDSSYPTEYTIRYSYIVAIGPTFELALRDFIEYLTRSISLLPAETKSRKKRVRTTDNT